MKFFKKISRIFKSIYPYEMEKSRIDKELASEISKAESQAESAISMAKKASKLLQPKYVIALWTAKNRASLLIRHLAPTPLELAVINTPQSEIDEFLNANKGFLDTFIYEDGTSRMVDIQKKILEFMLIEEAKLIRKERIDRARIKYHSPPLSITEAMREHARKHRADVEREQQAAKERMAALEIQAKEQKEAKEKSFVTSPNNSSSESPILSHYYLQCAEKLIQKPNEQETPECYKHRFSSFI